MLKSKCLCIIFFRINEVFNSRIKAFASYLKSLTNFLICSWINCWVIRDNGNLNVKCCILFLLCCKKVSINILLNCYIMCTIIWINWWILWIWVWIWVWIWIRIWYWNFSTVVITNGIWLCYFSISSFFNNNTCCFFYTIFFCNSNK